MLGGAEPEGAEPEGVEPVECPPAPGSGAACAFPGGANSFAKSFDSTAGLDGSVADLLVAAGLFDSISDLFVVTVLAAGVSDLPVLAFLADSGCSPTYLPDPVTDLFTVAVDSVFSDLFAALDLAGTAECFLVVADLVAPT